MTRRTYSRDDWLAAQEAWAAGGFSAEWKPWRHLAAMEASIIFPPDGTKTDSWEDDSPSQRAMLIRAIREQPTLLRRGIPGARSWGDVIERLLRARDDWREEQAQLAAERDRVDELRRPTYREAVLTIRMIVDRIAES